MFDIELYFVGGVNSRWTNVPIELVVNLKAWLDDDKDKSTFKVNFISHDKEVCVRKENVLFINVLGSLEPKQEPEAVAEEPVIEKAVEPVVETAEAPVE